jgi:hypothetical protein
MTTKAKGIGGHHSANMRTDEWLTPPEILKPLGVFDLDPCAPINRPWSTARYHYSILDNGLIREWFGRVWLNPPYGRELGRWMYKMRDHKNGIALIFARTETADFFNYVWGVAESIFFIKKRLHFYSVDGKRAKANSGAPSVLISYSQEDSDIMEDSGLEGKHVPLKQHIIVVGVSPTWYSVLKIAIGRCGDDDLQPIYEMVEQIAPDKIAANQHWKAKIRQQIQLFRKRESKMDQPQLFNN